MPAHRSRSPSPTAHRRREQRKERRSRSPVRDRNGRKQHREHDQKPADDCRGKREENSGADRRRQQRSPSFSDIIKEDPDRDERRRAYERKLQKKTEVKVEGGDEHDWGKEPAASTSSKPGETGEDVPPIEKEKANFGLSGALAKDTNTVLGIVLKHTEPPEAAKPKTKWMWYVFTGDEFLEKMHLHRQSSFLIGRHPKICDIPMLHPSISTQHAALQYRRIKGRVRPYIIDLGSSNGTTINGNKIDSLRYYELMEKDVCKFGFSSRDYVLLNEHMVPDVGDDEQETTQSTKKE